MDDGTLPGGDIHPGSDVPMDDGTLLGHDICLGSDVSMEEGTIASHDISLDSDVSMEEGTLPGGDMLLGSHVPMEDGIFPGSNIPLHSDILLSPSATLHVQGMRDPVMIPAGDIVLPGDVLLAEAMRHLDCSLEAVGISQDGPSSMPSDPTIPHHKISSLWLPKKMLSADYSVPKTSKAILSMEHYNTARMKPEDPQQDAGTTPGQHVPTRHQAGKTRKEVAEWLIAKK